jgi:hypothetical protein
MHPFNPVLSMRDATLTVFHDPNKQISEEELCDASERCEVDLHHQTVESVHSHREEHRQ